MSSRAQQTSAWPTSQVTSSDHVAVDLVGPGSPLGNLTRGLRSTFFIESLRTLWARLSTTSGLRFQGRTRRLQLQESVQLGEKRFVAILRVDGDEFLLGGSASGVSILGQLQPEPAAEPFSVVLGKYRAPGERA